MDDETTTNASEDTGGQQQVQGVPIDDQGQAIPQPDESEPAEAVDETPDQTPAEGEEQAEEAPEPSEETDDTSDWLKKKGIDPTDPEAINKLAKSAREAERAMHRNAQKASELEKASRITEEQIIPDATPEQRDNIRLRNIEMLLEAQRWKLNNPDKLAHESDMYQVLVKDPNKRLMLQEGFLNYDDIYALARGNQDNETSIKSQGKREALESLAHKQQAAVPKGNAVTSGGTSNKITPQNVDAMVANMSPEEYKRRLPEINQAMAG